MRKIIYYKDKDYYYQCMKKKIAVRFYVFVDAWYSDFDLWFRFFLLLWAALVLRMLICVEKCSFLIAGMAYCQIREHEFLPLVVWLDDYWATKYSSVEVSNWLEYMRQREKFLIEPTSFIVSATCAWASAILQPIFMLRISCVHSFSIWYELPYSVKYV